MASVCKQLDSAELNLPIPSLPPPEDRSDTTFDSLYFHESDFDEAYISLKEETKHNTELRPNKVREEFNVIINDVSHSHDLTTSLINIRDEMFSMINAYKSLYESSVSFGIQKALIARRQREELMSENESLKSENAIMKTKIDELKRDISEKYKIELNKLRERNNLIKKGLEDFVNENGDKSPQLTRFKCSTEQ